MVEERIKELCNAGKSLRSISRDLNLHYSTVRRIAIQLQVFEPVIGNVVEGKTICIRCKSNKSTDCFPYLFTDSKHVCDVCLNFDFHKIQIAKIGCTPKIYAKLIKKQNSKCAICHKSFGHVRNGKACKLAVDHDHTTGKIRGLLCSCCNRGIGMIGENNLEKAVEYLKNYCG